MARPSQMIREALSEIPPHQKVHLHAIARSSKELLHYLNQLNIKLGTTIEVLQMEAFDNSLLVSFDGREAITISQKVAKRLLVK